VRGATFRLTILKNSSAGQCTRRGEANKPTMPRLFVPSAAIPEWFHQLTKKQRAGGTGWSTWTRTDALVWVWGVPQNNPWPQSKVNEAGGWEDNWKHEKQAWRFWNEKRRRRQQQHRPFSWRPATEEANGPPSRCDDEHEPTATQESAQMRLPTMSTMPKTHRRHQKSEPRPRLRSV